MSMRRGLLYLEVSICFGPVFLLVVAGLFASPLWIAGVAGNSVAVGASTWDSAWPLATVGCGLLGLWGLARLLRLLTSTRPVDLEPRVLTLALLGLGLAGLLLFNVVAGPLPVALDPESWLALTLYFVLPLACAVHLVLLLRKKLSPINPA